jgi:hypothetical protein
MRALLKKCLLGSIVCLGASLTAERAQAQVIWGGETERYFRPGAYSPYDGQNYQQQYGYSTGQAFVYPFSGSNSASQLWALDHADRVGRAYKFGYAVPPEPGYAPAAGTARPWFGLGFGIFRAR